MGGDYAIVVYISLDPRFAAGSYEFGSVSVHFSVHSSVAFFSESVHKLENQMESKNYRARYFGKVFIFPKVGRMGRKLGFVKFLENFVINLCYKLPK